MSDIGSGNEGTDMSVTGGDDSQNADYKSGRYYVISDSLNVDESMKYHLEYEVRDQLVMSDLGVAASTSNTFATSAVGCETVSVERKQKPDGTPYILVRPATDDERDQFFGMGDYAEDDDSGDAA